MKYIKYLLLSIILLPCTVFAYEFKCTDGKYNYEDTFECVVKGNPNTNYDEISGSLELSSNSFLSCEFVNVENGLTKINEIDGDAKKFKLNGILTSEEIIKVNCKVATKPTTSQLEQLVIPNLTYDISDDNISAKTEVLRANAIQLQEYIETPTGDQKPRNTENPNSRAKQISDSNLDFTFSAFKTIYNLSVKYEVSSIDLMVVPNNENATYRIEGSQELQVGTNVIDVYITSPDETVTTCYTFNITRLKRGEDIYYPEKDCSLSELTIEGYPINFEPIIYDYKIHLPYNVNNLSVKAKAKEDGSIIEMSNTSDLINGSIIEIKVTSQDGSKDQTYRIIISKDPAPKDYRTLIYTGVIIGAFLIVVIIIIITNTRNKNNPLLKSKKQAGPDVPPVESAPIQQEVQTPSVPLQQTQTDNNVPPQQ